MISGSSRTLLILDDVTSSIASAQQQKGSIWTEYGTLTKAKALMAILNDMFNRARHYNCLILMFVHHINTFEDSVINNIHNFLLFDASAVTTMESMKRFDMKTRKFLRAMVNASKIFDKNKYSYYAVLFNRTTSSILVTKAHQLSPNETIGVHPDVKRYHELLDKVQVGAVNPVPSNSRLDVGQRNIQQPSPMFEMKSVDEKDDDSSDDVEINLSDYDF